MMSNKSSCKVLPLAPKGDLDHTTPQYLVYEKYLNEAFRDSRIRNIALSGNLGSGKSSILKSFDNRRNKKTKFLYVSLIDFTTADNSTVASQQRLEYSLLCQILSRCRPSDIPASSLRTIPSKFRYLRTISAIFAMICLAIFVLIFHDKFGRLAEILGFEANVRALIHLLIYAGIGVVLSVVLFFLSKHILVRKGLHKITLKTNLAEAEIDMGSDKTSLDEYRFELVYALCQIGKKIDYTVVFEDLDRIKESTAVEIMEKLREINLLANNYLSTTTPFYMQWFYSIFKTRKHLRFIYAVGEDVFGYDQRTKFYDYIIPVVPALNKCNSEYKMFHLLIESGVNLYPDKLHQLIRDVAPIITDYRSLIAVRNEYLFFEDIYLSNHKNRMNSLTLEEKSTLLAIVVYKTLFPQKYSKAFSERGQAMLERITAEDFNEPDKGSSYCDLIIKTFNKLFDEKVLKPTSLKMVGMTNARIVDRWIRILREGSDNEKIRLLKSLTKSGYANDSTTQQESRKFIKQIVTNKFLGKTQNKEVAQAIADFLSSNEQTDYKWILNDFKWNTSAPPSETQKQHFTNCIAYAAGGNHAAYYVLSQKLGTKYLFRWCLWNLSGFADDELLQHAWTTKMAKELIRYLRYDPQSIPEELLKKQLTEGLTLNQLLRKELSLSAPLGR